jgi:hypothetical protein
VPLAIDTDENVDALADSHRHEDATHRIVPARFTERSGLTGDYLSQSELRKPYPIMSPNFAEKPNVHCTAR